MKCRATPYQGQEPFVFFSYCHGDSQRVYPLIERLTEMGYRIWFDNGIGIGEEWPEIIARKLEECTIFVAAITPAYCCSHNCKNEMTFQVEDKKPMLPLMLEDFPLIGGIKLQLTGTQYLRLFERQESTWPETVAGFAPLAQCKGAPMVLPDSGIKKKPPQEAEKPATKKAEAVRVLQERNEDSQPTRNKEEERPAVASEDTSVVRKMPAEVPAGSVDVLAREKAGEDPQNEKKEAWAVCLENGRVLFSRDAQVILTQGQQQPGPILCWQDEKVVVINCDNSTITLGNTPLQPGDCGEVHYGEQLHTNKENYLLLPFRTAGEEESLRQTPFLRMLQADSTGERRVILDDPMHLGRSYAWEKDVFTDRRISRHHADIVIENGSSVILDHSANGTFVEDEPVEGSAILNDGCKIRMGHEAFHYQQLPLDFGDEVLEEAYDQALALLETGDTLETLAQAERLFGQAVSFRDSGMMQLRCKEKQELLRREEQQRRQRLYEEACLEMQNGQYASAEKKFLLLPEYLDAEERLTQCMQARQRELQPDDDEKTIREKPVPLKAEQLLIVELRSGEVFRGKPQSTVIGRKINQCDIPFPDNGRMSRRHVELFTLNGAHYVRDCHSSNGTWLNGQMLTQDQTVKISDTAILNLAGTWLLAAFDAKAEQLQRLGEVTYLEAPDTGEWILGTEEKWEFQAEDPDATISNGHSALYSCADFWQDSEGAWLQPNRDGSVWLNGQPQPQGKAIGLENGDRLRIGEKVYDFRSVRLIALQKA